MTARDSLSARDLVKRYRGRAVVDGVLGRTGRHAPRLVGRGARHDQPYDEFEHGQPDDQGKER